MAGLRVTHNKSLNEQTNSLSEQRDLSKFDNLPDFNIWTSFKKGEDAAFNYIYKKYFYQLYNYGNQFINDADVIQDLIQDLFIELREKRKNLGDVESIKFYLYKILKRKILHYKKKNVTDLFSDSWMYEKAFDITLSHETNLINTQISKETKEKLSKVMNMLSKRQKEIIIYYFYEGMTYKQIAELMDFSKVEHARVLVSRSIAKLREEIKKYSISLFIICFVGLVKWINS
ncbi:RNA polymerase sigma factor [Chondrinema litorale]|uniref:RNA polymerase sigma factor n=1 Tax=Chondrinema litorale TaxID=2994555 RepID=UPI0025438884|nr:sigma-70 family RNA polymerase sigma factor [Chondrinema litorale]UZR96591.1 sigma-70 family RNA polymerase sigma factor [Chondrinema litorale]